MATSDDSSSSSGATSSEHNDSRLGVPSRNPLPLSASQEAQVREVFYARVRRQCAPEIKAFAECALGRTVTLAFACRDSRHAMNNCMKARATPQEEDAAREEWFAGRVERQRERERKYRRKLEQESFMREWWGLPERDAEARRREEEKMRREERVGGFRAAREQQQQQQQQQQQPPGRRRGSDRGDGTGQLPAGDDGARGAGR